MTRWPHTSPLGDKHSTNNIYHHFYPQKTDNYLIKKRCIKKHPSSPISRKLIMNGSTLTCHLTVKPTNLVYAQCTSRGPFLVRKKLTFYIFKDHISILHEYKNAIEYPSVSMLFVRCFEIVFWGWFDLRVKIFKKWYIAFKL